MQMNGGTFPKTQGPAETQEEVAEEETGTGDNDIGRNVPFFETRYPMTSNRWRLRLLDQAIPFLDLGPLDGSKRLHLQYRGFRRTIQAAIDYLCTLRKPVIAVACTTPELSVTDLTFRHSIVVTP
jgi:hypothetical protein